MIFKTNHKNTRALLDLELGLIYYMDSWVTHSTFWEQNNLNKQIN